MTCIVCDGRRFVWEFVGEEATQAPCPRCGPLLPPSEDSLDALFVMHTTKRGARHAA